jgi:hypothetical protein
MIYPLRVPHNGLRILTIDIPGLHCYASPEL